MIYDGYDLWERFCIMTVDGNVPDILALKILERKTTPRLYSWLEWKVKEGKRKNGASGDTRKMYGREW